MRTRSWNGGGIMISIKIRKNPFVAIADNDQRREASVGINTNSQSRLYRTITWGRFVPDNTLTLSLLAPKLLQLIFFQQ